MCYAGAPAKANRSAYGIAAACTLRNWIGMWSLRHAQTRAEPHLALIDCPALVINAEQDTGVYPSDAQRIHDALASTDKTLCSIDTDHYFTTPGARSEQADTIAKWIAKRWREGSRAFHPRREGARIPCPEADWLESGAAPRTTTTTFYRELPDAEVIWHVLRPMSGADLENGARECRLVHKLGAGVNTIDVDAATRCGIAVANMPGANAPSVAEGTVLLMLAALRRLPVLDRATRAGRGWPSDPSLGETVRDIGGCTVGLVGYGNIAKRVETIVAAHGRRRAAHQHPRRRPPRLASAARTARRAATSSRCTCR